MSYTALYRLYRPSNFEGLVGQEHIKRTLFNALVRQQFAHAYLFTGPRGTGKTSAAKLIAKAVNCETPLSNGEPCNECGNCKAANNNSMPDILEIDAASNNGVDEVRKIIEQVHFTPGQGKYKVFIIDEVHMLTVSAFNALLKTLEEPPKHVIFILATTEPHKVLATIVSRCQRLDFRRINPKSIVERMQFIAQQQNLVVDEEALSLIANIAQGGMRDALSLLDQTIAYSDGKVTADDVTSVVGKTSIRFIGNVIDLIEKGDLTSLIDQVDEIINEGKEPEYFISDLIGYYRDILVFQSTTTNQLVTTAVVDDQFKALASKLNAGTIQKIVDELLSCQSALKWTKQAKTTIEVTLVKLLDLKVAPAPVAATTPTSSMDVGSQVAEVLIEQISELRAELNRMKNNQQTMQVTTAEVDVKSIILNTVLPTATKPYVEYIKSRFNEIVAAIGTHNEALYHLLSESQPVVCSKEYVVICGPTTKHVEFAYKGENITIIEQGIENTIGQPLKVVFAGNEEWSAIANEYRQIVAQRKQHA